MYTYVFKAHGQQHKIGKAMKVKDRFNTLRIGNPDLQIVKKFEGNFETKLHVHFSDKKIRGEWFILTEEDVVSIDGLIDKYRLDELITIPEEPSATDKEMPRSSCTIQSPQERRYMLALTNLWAMGFCHQEEGTTIKTYNFEIWFDNILVDEYHGDKSNNIVETIKISSKDFKKMLDDSDILFYALRVVRTETKLDVLATFIRIYCNPYVCNGKLTESI